MAKTHPKQLELPVMVDVNAKAQACAPNSSQGALCAVSDTASFIKAASAEDQSIYKLIRDSYFNCKR